MTEYIENCSIVMFVYFYLRLSCINAQSGFEPTYTKIFFQFAILEVFDFKGLELKRFEAHLTCLQHSTEF